LSKEVNDSKTTLEALIGKKVYSFCYPSGKYSPEVIASVAKAGYLMAVTTAKGAPFPSGAPLEIPRYRINPTTNISSLF
jgi:peptidoglycan/xylan/chitin deacetylase (PgdA/CDA1 family)